MEEQKEFRMSSAYMSRLQHDVQLSNLYLNHLRLFNESERWSRQIVFRIYTNCILCFYLFNYSNIQFIFNWKHFSCFILNKIFNAKVFMHYFNSITLKYHTKWYSLIFFQLRHNLSSLCFSVPQDNIAVQKGLQVVTMYIQMVLWKKAFGIPFSWKLQLQSLSAPINFYPSAKHPDNQAISIAFLT